MTPELQAYLLWLNQGNPPASQGDAFLGGPVGLPSPFPPYFDVTSPVFGAKGDSNSATNDSVAIQAAIDAAYNATSGDAVIGVFIPDAPVQSGGSPGFYNLKNVLTVHNNTRIFGAGMWTTILHFPNDTGGILGPENADNVSVERLSLIGNGPLSASSTVTTGMYLLSNSFWSIRDVYVQDFVDALVFDASNIGSALHQVDHFITYNRAYPNAVNGYPRYGIRMTCDNGQHRVQAVRIGGGSTISGSTHNNPDEVITGDGVTTTYNLKPTAPLWAENGIKVYLIGTLNIITPLTSGVDYNLYDFTTGSNVLIPHGSFGSKSQNVNVIFTSAPANGATYRLEFSDPTMLIGLYLDHANGNSIELTQIQGAQTLCVDDLGNNMIHVAEIEIANVAYRPGGAQYSEFTFGHSENSIGQLYSTSSPGSTGNSFQIGDRGAGWGWSEAAATNVTGTQTFTSSTPTVIQTDSNSAGTLQFVEGGRCNREVQVECTLGFANTAGGAAEAELIVQVSFDAGVTWTEIGHCDVSGYCSTSSTFYSTVSQTFRDVSDMAIMQAGSYQAVLYRTLISVFAGTSVKVVTNSGNTLTYRLRARDVNRPGD